MLQDRVQVLDRYLGLQLEEAHDGVGGVIVVPREHGQPLVPARTQGGEYSKQKDTHRHTKRRGEGEGKEREEVDPQMKGERGLK